jgi:hypothetical protein
MMTAPLFYRKRAELEVGEHIPRLAGRRETYRFMRSIPGFCRQNFGFCNFRSLGKQFFRFGE